MVRSFASSVGAVGRNWSITAQASPVWRQRSEIRRPGRFPFGEVSAVRFPCRQVRLRPPTVSRSVSPTIEPKHHTLSSNPNNANARSNSCSLPLSDKLSAEVKKCGVTKTISPPTIKQEPAEETSQPMLPDSSSDRGSSSKRGAPSHVARVKMEHLEVKQEPGTWDGEVSIRSKMRSNPGLLHNSS